MSLILSEKYDPKTMHGILNFLRVGTLSTMAYISNDGSTQATLGGRSLIITLVGPQPPLAHFMN